MTLDDRLEAPEYRERYLRGLRLTRYMDASRGCCAMGAVSLMTGGPRRCDTPPTVSPILAAVVRAMNDSATDAARQELLPLLSTLPGTADPTDDDIRTTAIVPACGTLFLLPSVRHRLPGGARARAAGVATAEEAGAVWRQIAVSLLHEARFPMHAEAAVSLAAAAGECDPMLRALLVGQAVAAEIRANDAAWPHAIALLRNLAALRDGSALCSRVVRETVLA